MQEKNTKVSCPTCKVGILEKLNLKPEELLFGSPREYQCVSCKEKFTAYEWYGERDKQPLPDIKEGFIRENLESGNTIEYRKDKQSYINEDGLEEYSKMYDRYGRVLSKFVMLDLSKWNGEVNTKYGKSI